MGKNNSTKNNKLSKKLEFNFKDIVVSYDLPNLIHVFFQSDDNKYNSEIDGIIKDMGYIRERLVKSYPLIELNKGFEYKWMGLYITKEHLEDINAERQRRDNIRKAPIII